MHLLITGANGVVGRFITRRMLDDGHKVTALGRRPVEGCRTGFCRFDLSEAPPELPEADILVHCAFQHEPGKYRGGEGDDPHGFIQANAEGTQRLFEAAKRAGVRHCVFLSSRAVYTDTGNWAVLNENSETQSDSLYGQVKLAGEEALKSLCDEAFSGSVLRATGVYGCPPGLSEHKWSDLFIRLENGEDIAPRLGTEVHGEDLADAVLKVLNRNTSQGNSFEVFNVSDLLLDRQDLLKSYARVRNISVDLPARAPGPLGVMDAGKLKVLGWQPGGSARLQSFLEKSCVAEAGNQD
ncbi:NAD-dependent epimerase/dehydratase family protein [Roseibium sp. SCP14]|uniref:NAD-dependent epimerase/dehydratase family protein n=1 Tax=Roseibium sp. SCP14 TaxID=3141375 RepID=UPI00333C5172